MLKVIKYKNHGICLRGGEKEEHHHKFLFSFFELNNKKVVSLMIVENWYKKKLISDEYNCCYTKHELDQPWNKWWESTFKDNLMLIDSETHEFIKIFFKKNLYKNRYNKTNIIEY